MNVFNSVIGIGILAQPYSFSLVGVVAGVLGILMVGSLNYYTMSLQITCSKKVGEKAYSYPLLGLYSIGLKGKYIIDISIIFI